MRFYICAPLCQENCSITFASAYKPEYILYFLFENWIILHYSYHLFACINFWVSTSVSSTSVLVLHIFHHFIVGLKACNWIFASLQVLWLTSVNWTANSNTLSAKILVSCIWQLFSRLHKIRLYESKWGLGPFDGNQHKWTWSPHCVYFCIQCYVINCIYLFNSSSKGI